VEVHQIFLRAKHIRFMYYFDIDTDIDIFVNWPQIVLVAQLNGNNPTPMTGVKSRLRFGPGALLTVITEPPNLQKRFTQFIISISVIKLSADKHFKMN
jgi:hypothetical protein